MRALHIPALLSLVATFVIALPHPPAFAAEPLRPWQDYRTIMWISDSAYQIPAHVPAFFARLREMGINTAMVHNEGSPDPLVANHFPYYVENMVNKGLCLKWNSKVRDWDKFVTEWAKSGRPDAALVREYGLDDPAWQTWARSQMQKLVRKHMSHEPLAYDIRDELSVTLSANPFDYDFSPLTLAAFRTWLKTQYKDLPALNAQWDTSFAAWDQVRPFTTDQVKNRMASGDAIPKGKPNWQAVQKLKFDPVVARKTPRAWNLSPWADFRTYMDICLARTLNDLRASAHELDPKTPVGIEGTQMPHPFGGYDLWRLSQSLDWVEPYDIANAREILGSFMPGQPILTTVGESNANAARRRLWHLLLEGDKGCIVWWSEDTVDSKTEGSPLTPKGHALPPVLKEMTSPLAALFLRATPQYDPIYLQYSQPSIQVDWLIESTVDGSTWLRRFSSYEAQHNRQAGVRNSWLKAFQDLGYAPRFISSQQIEEGLLQKGTPSGAGPARVLILPCAWSLSDKEAAAINTFLNPADRAATPNALFTDGTPGLFDAHGKLRGSSPLESVFPPAPSWDRAYAATKATVDAHPGDIATLAKNRLAAAPDAAWLEWIAAHCPLKPAIQCQTVPPSNDAASRTRIHRYKLAAATLLAFERNVDYQMSEDLKQAGGNQKLESAVELQATLPAPAHVYDLRTQKYLGRVAQFRFTLDPWQPSLFAVLQDTIPPDTLVSALLAQAWKTK